MKNLLEFMSKRPAWIWALLGLLLLDLLVYGHVLITGRIISESGDDLAMGIWGMDFVSHEIRSGNLPLWNPYILSGTPSFASFQTLALYPPAVSFCIAPLELASNLYIIFHVFWVGAGMYWYLSRRNLHPFAAFVGAAMMMFASPTTMQIFPGHITVLSAMSWMPFLFVICDALIDEKNRTPWVLGGIAFVALQIAAGFPQHVFYTALAGAMYFVARLAILHQSSVVERLRLLACWGLVYFGGALLQMVQLLTSWQTSKETARTTALPFKFISLCSFPPENFLTLFAPTVYGGSPGLSYWGRWYLWEVMLFLGISSFFLVVWSLVISKRGGARSLRWLYAGLALFFILLGLGKYGPLLPFFYKYVPVFGSFRTSARALFQATFFLSALAALGYDQLLKNHASHAPRLKWMTGISVLWGFCLVGLGLWATSDSSRSYWQQAITAIKATQEYFIKPQDYDNPTLLAVAPQGTQNALMIGGLVCVAVGLLFWFSMRRPKMVYALGAMVIFEVVAFTAFIMPTFLLEEGGQPKLEVFLKQNPGDYRFVKKDFNNLALKWRMRDIDGYESFRLHRYDEYIEWSQGRKPDGMPSILFIAGAHKSYRMLRCKYAFDTDTMTAQAFDNVLPHALLIHRYRILKKRDEIFKTLDSDNFNYSREVILEEQPTPRPGAASAADSVQIKDVDTDTLEINATTAQPALLIVTDAYSKGWRAAPMEGSAQQSYTIMPANYILRAIPLQAGTHHIRMEYVPPAFVLGRKISLAALAIYLISCGFYLVGWRKALSNASRASG